MEKLLILAGGFGTRLKAVVSGVPKPLAPVVDTPFLVYLIKNFISQGVKDFLFLLHYDHQKIQQVLNKLEEEGVFDGISVACIVESSPLGTGGSILNAVIEAGVTEPFLVANADTWNGVGLKELSNTEPPALLAIENQDTLRYGSLVVEGNKVVKFNEKVAVNGPALINGGVYRLHPDNFVGFEKGMAFSLEKIILPALAQKRVLSFTKITTNFIDIGIPQDYFRFCKWIEGGKKHGL